MGFTSPGSGFTAPSVFFWIFGLVIVIIIGVWITVAVTIVRNRRVFRQAGMDPTTAGAQLAVRMMRGQPSTSARLAELTDLRDRGLITPAEYEARRAQIIATI
jgi:Short C-terminal domain